MIWEAAEDVSINYYLWASIGEVTTAACLNGQNRPQLRNTEARRGQSFIHAALTERECGPDKFEHRILTLCPNASWNHCDAGNRVNLVPLRMKRVLHVDPRYPDPRAHWREHDMVRVALARTLSVLLRSEERRVGKECRSRWSW